jgi:hypothetical protein
MRALDSLNPEVADVTPIVPSQSHRREP